MTTRTVTIKPIRNGWIVSHNTERLHEGEIILIGYEELAFTFGETGNETWKCVERHVKDLLTCNGEHSFYSTDPG